MNPNKNRGKAFEREVGKILHGKRYPSDTGGIVDVLTEHNIHVQCKKWKQLSMKELEYFVCEIADYVKHQKLSGTGVVAHKRPLGKGRHSEVLVTLKAEDFYKILCGGFVML